MKLQNWAPVIIGIFMLAAPVLATAQSNSSSASAPSNSSQASAPSNSSANSVFQLKNPLSVGNFCDLLKQIFNDILLLGIPVATLFIVFAGFQLVSARGNGTKLTKAKTNLWYIVIGIALFLGAWTLSQIIANTLSALGGGGGLC